MVQPALPDPFAAPPPPWYESTAPPSNQGGIIVFLVIALAGCLLGFLVCGLLKKYRDSRDNAEAAAAAARLPALAWPQALLQLEPSLHFVELRLRQARTNVTIPGARLPAFSYNRSVKQDVTGGGEEAATCSVCLGAFQQGETVRLLPVCLHLFHVECIDLWLDAHSTCPICRSDTDPTMDGA